MTEKNTMIPAYFWKATNAPGGILGKLPNYEGFETAAAVAASHYEAWLLDQDPRKMQVVQSCMMEKNWAYEPTGHKTFDEQRRRSSGLMTGYVSSNVQTSTYIRSKTCQEVNGLTYEPGELRAHDLKYLGGLQKRGAPKVSLVKDWINDSSLDDVTTIAYLLHHHKDTRDSRGDREMVFHGWILTDSEYNLLHSCQTNPGQKSEVIMSQAIKALTLERFDSQDLLRIEDGVVQYVSEEVRALLSPEVIDLADAMEARRDADAVERPRGG